MERVLPLGARILSSARGSAAAAAAALGDPFVTHVLLPLLEASPSASADAGRPVLRLLSELHRLMRDVAATGGGASGEGAALEDAGESPLLRHRRLGQELGIVGKALETNGVAAWPEA